MEHRTQYNIFIAGVIVELLAVAVFWPAGHFSFVDWDDPFFVLNNETIRTFDLELFRKAFLSFDDTNYWLPLSWISYATEFHFWGLDPLGYHLDNIFLHGLNALFVTLLTANLLGRMRRSGSEEPLLTGKGLLVASFFAGLLFALHPLRVESVAWVAERKGLLSTAFILPSLSLYLSYAARRQRNPGRTLGWLGSGRYWSSFILFLLALMSKPTVVAVPVVLLILDWYPLRRFACGRRRLDIAAEKIPFFMASALVSLITLAAQDVTILPLRARLLIASRAIVTYLRMTVWPSGLSPYYELPGRDATYLTADYLLPAALVAAITVACLVAARRQKFWLATWGYFVVTLLPVLGVVAMSGEQAMADRFTYLPGVGPAILLAAGCGLLYRSVSLGKRFERLRHWATLAVLLGVTGGYALVARQLLGVWHDSNALWSRVITVYPDDASRGYFYRGMYHLDCKEYREADEDLTHAIAILTRKKYRVIHMAYVTRAQVREKLGHDDDALEDYANAILTSPDPGTAQGYHALRGRLFQRLGRQQEAAEELRAVAMPPPGAHAADK